MRNFIYIRYHKSYKGYVKLGKTKCIINRGSTYVTGELERGAFIKVYEVSDHDECEIYLQEIFREYHYQGSGGNEFYHKRILEFIDEEIKEYDGKEIRDLSEIERHIYERTIIERYMKNLKRARLIKKVRKKQQEKKEIRMRDYQIKDNIMKWFDMNDKGILNWPCGLGKTITSLNVSKRYTKNLLMIGLPTISLFTQWIEYIEIFYNYPILCIGSTKIKGYETMHNKEDIERWVNKYSNGILITTYASSYKLKDISREIDFVILDECHHLCSGVDLDEMGEEIIGGRKRGKNVDILDVKCKKRLGLTATMRKYDKKERFIMNDNFNEELFGNIIDEKTISWAIDHKYLCNYELLTLGVTQEYLEDIILKDIDISPGDRIRNYHYLCLAAYLSIQAIEKYGRKKILIFTNRIEDIEKVYQNIEIWIKETSKISMDHVIRIDKNTKNIGEIIKNFEILEYGIMINVYKIGEGVDIPSLDAVLLADDMESKTRIIQSLLRCCRIDPKNSEKIANFIIPMIYEEVEDGNYNKDDDIFDIKSFGVIQHVIEEMSHSDENIIDKIKMLNVSEGSGGRRDIIKKKDTDIDLTNGLKIKITKRCDIGVINIRNIIKKIKKMGGRHNQRQSFYRDYKDTKSEKNGLPDADWIKRTYIDSRRYTWFDLYSINTGDYLSWDEFRKKYEGMRSEDYESTRGTYECPYDDLEIFYNKNYNMPTFWDRGDCEEEY